MLERASPARRAERRLRRQYLHAFAATACVGPFLSYVLVGQGWTAREIGYAVALLTASAVITAPVWGWIDDVWHGLAARLSLVATAVTSVALTISVAEFGTFTALSAVALLGAASGSLEALLATRTLRDPRTAARLGTSRSLGSLGWILGLVLGGVFLTVIEQSALVFLVAGVAAISAPRPDRQATAGTRPPEMSARRTAVPPLRPVLGVLSLTFPLPLCIAGLMFFTAGWAHSDLGAGPLVAVGPLALTAALELPAFLLVDRLARRVDSLWLCALAFPPLAIGTLALALVPTKGVLFAIQPLVAMSFTLWFVGQTRLMSERVSIHQLASALTLLSTLGRGIAGPLAGIAGGAIAAAGGYSALFYTMAALCVFGFFRALLPMMRDVENRNRLG